MREQFAIWYPRTADDYARFVTDGLIAVDANVLLHLYRLTPDVRKDVLALFGRIGERLWIPHQVGLEFHRNRLTVIREQEQTEQKLRTAVDETADRLDQVVNGFRDHPAIDKAALRSIIDAGFAEIRTYLDAATTGSYLSVQAAMRSDKVLDSITALFAGKVGEPYSDDRMRELEAVAKDRFEQLIPPGYADKKKDGNRDCGDYILWRQLLDEAAERKVPVVFITNDQKEDWYRRIHGLTTGPRFELVNEMQQEAGVDFHAQTLALFIDRAPASLRAPVKETTVTEVVRLDELDRASAMADTASDIAAGNLTIGDSSEDAHQSLPAQRGRDGDIDVQVARLQARRAELQKRLGELQAEIEADRNGGTAAEQDSDPRSYSRAILARVEVTTSLLEEATKRLTDLQSVNMRPSRE